MPIEPDEQQFAEIAGLAGTEADGPVVMLNLNRYRERAQYDGDVPDGLEGDVSGHEAYLRYGIVAVAVLARVGGKVLWQADAKLIAPGLALACATKSATEPAGTVGWMTSRNGLVATIATGAKLLIGS